MSINQTKIDAVTKAATAVDAAIENLSASSTPADVNALSGLVDKLKTAVNA